MVFSLMNKNPHAQALGKLGGSKKSPAKALAAKQNGKKGGRPKMAHKSTSVVWIRA